MGKSVNFKDLLAEILILLIFSYKNNLPINANTSVLVCGKARVTFRVMYLSRCVIVDDSGNYVTFHKLNVRSLN